jgi:hypothetical protein
LLSCVEGWWISQAVIKEEKETMVVISQDKT